MRNTIKPAMLLVMIVVVCSGQRCLPDTDSDGVPDVNDGCVNTPVCATVDANGCPSDDDNDGVANGCDECQGTPADTMVYGNGCDATSDGVPVRCQGPDPRAKEIEYSLVNLIDETSATIRVKGVVDNIGTTDYTSVAGRQAIELWADNASVASTSFVNLQVDESITVEYEVVWDLSSEFPPAEFYKLIISYDPDIRDDGIATNDDCRLTNNTLIRSAVGIETLFD